jgi:hypothetical protein
LTNILGTFSMHSFILTIPIAKQTKYDAKGAGHDEIWTHFQNEGRSPCTG